MLYSSVRFSGKSNLPDFEVEGHFLLEARKKSRLQGRGCIFSRSPIVQVVAFRLFFDVLLYCSAGNLVLQLRGPHLRIWPWWRRRSSMAGAAALSAGRFPPASTGRVGASDVLAGWEPRIKVFRRCSAA